MDSDSSGVVDTTYSVDICIANHIKRNREERKNNEQINAMKRKEIFDQFMASHAEEFFSSMQGMHFYTFTENKIKFGFNPSEVAHVSRKIKFICILKYTGRHWKLGRNTIPTNCMSRIFDLFFGRKSVEDRFLPEVIDSIHSIFLDWSKEHEEFRRNKIQRYRNGEIEFFDLDSDDEELHLSKKESEELRKRREQILLRMIPPKKRRRVAKKPDVTDFMPCPSF